MAISRNQQLATMPRKYVMCRVYIGHHSPDGEPQIFASPGGGYEQVFTCRFCGTEISKFRDRHGFITGQRRYNYPSVEDGEQPYVMQEGGVLTKGEKADLFLRESGFSSKVRKLPRAASRKPARKPAARSRRGSAS